MRVWVDLTNSPHALFFAPIARAIAARGDEVLVTARHFAYTVELAEKLFDAPLAIGSGARQSLAGKVGSLGARVRELRPVIRRFAPDVAVAHGSYDQPITARLLGIPQLTMVDYEYHPGTHLLFRLATRLLLPEAFSRDLVNSHGGRGKTWRYRGLKEEVYLTGFRPSEAERTDLGIADRQGPVVTLRPPAVGAMYHRQENPLWPTLINHLQQQTDVLTFVLPRHPSHVPQVKELCEAPNVHVLEHTVDGPALVWWSDALISAGGTMNREAVALGTPVWSMFSGRLGSVDRALIAAGRLRRLTSASDVSELVFTRRKRPDVPEFPNDVLGQVLRAIDRTALIGRRRHRPGGAR